MTVEEINRIEPNGSTALHVAAYRGYEKIVELLLDYGASCVAKNKYKCIPLDEAKTDKIKQMIRRKMNETRSVSNSCWDILSTNDTNFQADEYQKTLKKYGKDRHFYHLIGYIKQNYIEKELHNIYGINIIQEYFDKAINEKDPTYLLKAHSADTGFYHALNKHLAQLQLEDLSATQNLSLSYFIGIIAHHPKFETLSYIGQVFRGMMITTNDIKQYTIGTRILTKIFVTTSKQRDLALNFPQQATNDDDRLSAICVYEIRNARTALDIQDVSLCSHEREVLILPYSTFQIIDIKQNRMSLPRLEIKLRELER
ncbi:unnamed protein product [Rotaria sordida]|uniref:NAD(+)--protein-arginine ADP-ribosyltransferase n=1 Tax=Rotaria sordida TaxID=392033 RepID=A0A819IQE2_9BILA|nr:unnamed protein product [Rotaria sordida]CAF3920383.1 unnamed protein product [Rotaria sordida]